jgi:hypothetical protein
LKSTLELAVPGIHVFVSSDPEDLKPGDPWVEVILDNLRHAELIVVPATERGLSRKWVWYESGATWSRGVRVIPCCVGTLRKGQLPTPFSTFQALNIDDAADFQRLLGIAAVELGLPEPKPFDIHGTVQNLKEADKNVITANPTFLPADEIKRRLSAVQLSVRLDQGTGQWFMLLVEKRIIGRS